VRKPKPETAAERVERMQQQISALRGRRDAAVDPLERGRLTISIREREAGLAIFQRTQRAAA
jgi:hypothetical protein